MAAPTLDEAMKRLDRALGLLEASVSRRMDAEKRRGGLETELQLMQDDRARLARNGVRLVEAPIAGLHGNSEGPTHLAFAGGAALPCRAVFLMPMGCLPSNLIRQLGCTLNEAGVVPTRDYEKTDVPGLYAAGDVVTDLHQLSIAVGHAALAATAIHNRLPSNPR